MTRSQNLRLDAVASVTSCNNISSEAILSYTWKLFKNSKYLPHKTSVSKNPRYFELPTYSLDTFAQYIIQVTVSDFSSSSSNSEYVLVNVISAGVTSIIKGGSERTVSSNNSLVIDASDSRDIDHPSPLSTLNFSWNCFVTYPSYGSPCGLSLLSQSVLIFPPRSLRSFHTYNFSVIVTGAYGHSSMSSVSITILDIDAPDISIKPLSSVQNTDFRTIISAIVNSTGPCSTSWSCANCNFKLSEASTTPVTMRFDGGNMLPINLVLPAHTLISGLTYTFTLSVSTWSRTGPTQPAVASIQIYMNSAPMGGNIAVSPASGQALSTQFSMVTYGWQDDAADYPLQFVFSYYTYDSSIANIVKSLSQLSHITSYLGQGLSGMGYAVTCVAAAYDIYNSSSITTTPVTVLPLQNLALLGHILDLKLSAASGSYDTDLATAIISSAVVAMNSANCTLAPNCVAINRSYCSSVKHTCGPCLDGYLGMAGPSNAPCNLAHALVSIGASCVMDSNCISNRCVAGTCKVSAKQCSGNCSGSAHGKCRYMNSNGETISFCDANSYFCQAQCFCFRGWYGADCSLNKNSYAYLQSMKEILSTSYLAVIAKQVTVT